MSTGVGVFPGSAAGVETTIVVGVGLSISSTGGTGVAALKVVGVSPGSTVRVGDGRVAAWQEIETSPPNRNTINSVVWLNLLKVFHTDLFQQAS